MLPLRQELHGIAALMTDDAERRKIIGERGAAKQSASTGSVRPLGVRETVQLYGEPVSWLVGLISQHHALSLAGLIRDG